jgi:hypothetical protein
MCLSISLPLPSFHLSTTHTLSLMALVYQYSLMLDLFWVEVVLGGFFPPVSLLPFLLSLHLNLSVSSPLSLSCPIFYNAKKAVLSLSLSLPLSLSLCVCFLSNRSDVDR